MGDVYCKICGEPWDVWSVKEDFSEKERKKFYEGKGCPACKGKPTYYCENCGKYFKGWMDFEREFPGAEEEVKRLIWEEKKCPYCFGKLKKVRFTTSYFDSVVENDGAIEDVLNVDVLSLL